MANPALTQRIHVVESTLWKDAVISILEPLSPYRPWRHGDGDALEGDAVAMILNTEPRSILTGFGRIGTDGNGTHVLADKHFDFDGTNLLHLGTFALMVGSFGQRGDPRSDSLIEGEAAEALERGLKDSHRRFDQSGRFGHSSMAAANILLRSQGRCGGCDQPLDLRGPDARDHVHIRTADFESCGLDEAEEPTDWPAVMCDSCHRGMRAGGFETFLEYRYSRHPHCPHCAADRTQSTDDGMPSAQDFPPWVARQGCDVSLAQWFCPSCAQEW